MTIRIVTPGQDDVIDANGRPTIKFVQWMQNVTDLQILSGSGSPEGVYEALEKKLYVDTSTSPPEVYVKVNNAILGDRTNGWELSN